MSLARYHKKRHFGRTPEPKGQQQTGEGPLTFVIQRHEASRLHYDFRLEMDGILKSWAVPKGPSLNPEDKRLAMMVEDHPLDYAGFEGIIPKGNYGAGTVMVWDKGVYMPYEAKNRKESEKILLEQLEKGHLTFVMLGEKLKGEFALIKTHGLEENAWLLVKKGDEYASSRDILKEDKSVISGRSMSEIEKEAQKKNQVWYSKPKSLDLKSLPSAKMPREVKPMLAETAEEPFDKKDWIFEMKWDGYRTIAEIENGKVKLYSRNLQSYNEKFSPVAKSLAKFPANAVLDGEVVVLDHDGRPNFQRLQDFPKSKKGNLTYYVFDALHLDGHDLTKLSLIERKEILQKILPPLPNIRFSEHITETGKEFFKQADKLKLEGIIAKNGRSIYEIGQRSDNWLKIKTSLRQEAVIAGFTAGKGIRNFFGALVLGVYKKGKLIYVGHAGGGFDEKNLEAVFKKLKPLVQTGCPFDAVPETNAPVTWVKPELLCEVDFKEWTKDGQMRQPIFIGLREDKKATEVTHESDLKKASNVSESEAEGLVEIGKHKLNLVNLDKVFWPDEGYTKGDLIHYYREISALILPHLKNRPQSLLRYPNGIEGEGFFQKDVSNLKLDWMMRARITHDDKTVEYMLVQDEASLIYLINLGCIDLNPWNSRVGHLNYPDYLVIDLDPEAIKFEQVVKVALVCRKVLESLGIKSYPKTSGATGMHIYIPMGAKYTYEQVKNFAHLLCIKINEHIPEITSLERSPKARQKKIYLDFLQNNRGQTLASVYSVRPKPQAPVSTPLKWEEVTSSLHPTQFTIKNTPQRLQKKGDLFKGVLEKAVDIKKILKKLEE